MIDCILIVFLYLFDRPGGEAKPGAKLAQTIASGIRGNSDEVDEMSSRMGRERIPDSSRKGSQSGGRGNYFAGQTATEKEAENKRKEAQNRAKETDKMSTGGGDRRRELEAKLSSKMRDSAQAKQQEQVEEELESRARRARAVISRKFSRPVERVLRVYNSDSTDLYDVLQVNKEADDSALKKAYRSLALSVHPGTPSKSTLNVATAKTE
jgi:DnaJ domain